MQTHNNIEKFWHRIINGVVQIHDELIIPFALE